MRSTGKRITARVLTFILTVVTVFQAVPAGVLAAEGGSVSVNDVQETEAPASVTDGNLTAQLSAAKGSYTDSADGLDVWQMKSAAGHGNGQPDDASGRAFYAVCEEDTAITDQDFSVKIQSLSAQSAARGGFVNKYAGDQSYSFIGWDTGNWYIQWGTSSYASLGGITVPVAGDEFILSGSWQENGHLLVTVDNLTQGIKESAEVTSDGFNSLRTTEGKFGFRAGYYGASTELLFSEVQMEGAGYYAGSWQSLYTAVDGQVLEVQEAPVTEEGKKWFYLNGGANNGGGHNYGNASAAAPVAAIDKDRTMPVDGSLSMKFKVLSDSPNFGIFYTYLDDSHWLYIGNDPSSGWYYQYKNGDKESYPALSGLPSPVNGEEMEISISLSHETLKVVVNGVTATTPNQDLYDLAAAIDGKGSFGVKTNNKNLPVSFTDVTLQSNKDTVDCMDDDWGFLAEREGQIFETQYMALVKVAGVVTDAGNDNEPLEGAVVRVGSNQATTGADGSFSMEDVQVGSYKVSASKKGYVSSSQEVEISADTMDLAFSLTSKADIDLSRYYKISSEDMSVYVAKDFPRVLRYDVNDQAVFTGQEEELSQVKINNTLVTPDVVINGFTDGDNGNKPEILYTLGIQDEAASLDLEMDVLVSVDGRNLTWEVTRLEKKEGCAMIGTIEIPDLNLVTIDAYQDETEFMGAKSSTNTTVSGDQRITFDSGFVGGERNVGYLYAFVSGDGYSAGVYSNSEAEGDLRILRSNGSDTISLTSAPWYYELGDKNGQDYATAQEGYAVSELPITKVCIADDQNDDGKVDWQDGAIAFRSIMNNPEGSDQMKDLVAYRIVMNFASAAPNPYLETADNIKKVYLATDGLGQSVMLKGYGNEGHDSANSEYADIAEREGGLTDFQNLIKIAHNYGALIGIHVNAQEVYPEAASFNESMIGTGTTGIGNGWGWLDQSHTIDKLWDLQSQSRYKRFVQLYDRINGTSFYDKAWDVDDKQGSAVGESTGSLTATMQEIYADALTRTDNMDFIYLDVWYQDSWETRRVAEEVQSLGWLFTTEFSDQGEYDSIWQHWATDASYGGSSSKGFNSDVIRFIRNHQRDSQVLNYPEYGGTADNPLLGGFRLSGFEGWGGDNSFDEYIYDTFKDNLPTRFLQHYEVTNWVNYEEDEDCPTGNHEKQITLKHDGDTVVVARNTEQRDDDEIEREITLNGNTVLSCTTDHFYYLLPWTDSEDDTEKLYHWNMDGGDSRWKVPSDWNGTVYLYELTDQGREEKQTLTVTDGVLVLEGMEAGVPYVIVKAEGARELAADYGEMDYVVDPGFNGYSDGETLDSADWSGDLDSFVVERGNRGDQYVKVEDAGQEAEASTTISGLTPGAYYVAEIYVDNRSDAKAYLEIKNGDEVLSGYTEKSIARNYIQCDEQHTASANPSYMQHILVPFQAEASTAVLTLRREAGEGATMWDDIRIVEQQIDNYKPDGSFEQDFESVVQGYYPFVLGSAQGVTDPVTHLSEAHEPYTSTGWNGRVIDDVIEGNYSLKHHGQNTGIIYQTIPQNFRFEEGKTYLVSFEYQTGADGAYAFVVGNGTSYDKPDTYFTSTAGKGTQTDTFRVTGGEGGQTWIGLYCNGTNDSESPMGEYDFVLDNLVITEEKDAVSITVADGKKSLLVGESVQLTAVNAEGGAWTSSDEAVIKVDPATGLAAAVGDGEAVITVTSPNGKTDSVTLKASSTQVKEILPQAVYANTQERVGEEGYAENAGDGDTGTIWHSQWYNGEFVVSESNPAILTIDLGEEMELNGFYFLQRSDGGPNGLVLKYQWAVGNSYDQDSFAITDGTLSEAIVTEEASQGSGGKEVITFDSVKARYIQLRVLEGNNGYASLAELTGINEQAVATEAELIVPGTDSNKGDTLQLMVNPTKGDLLVSSSWTSSDETVATVDGNGLVTFLKAGEVTITYTAGNGILLSQEFTVKGETQEPDNPDVEEPDNPQPDQPNPDTGDTDHPGGGNDDGSGNPDNSDNTDNGSTGSEDDGTGSSQTTTQMNPVTDSKKSPATYDNSPFVPAEPKGDHASGQDGSGAVLVNAQTASANSMNLLPWLLGAAVAAVLVSSGAAFYYKKKEKDE